jgi:AcrR family transcriptional regulator
MPKLIRDDALFEATVAVFAERGYAAATTREIAARAGVNEVTLFRRFGTKEALITAALADRLAASPFARTAATDDVEADLTALAQAYDETFRSYGGAVLTLLAEAPRHPELRAAVATLLPNLERAAAMIRAHQAAGRLADGDPFGQVIELMAPLLAAGLWARTGALSPAPQPAAASVARTFLDGHRSR